MENKVSSNPFESENRNADPSPMVEMHKPIQVCGFLINLMDLPQQKTQFIPEGTHYLPQYVAGNQPVTLYYPVYQPHPVPQQQNLHHQPSQPYPLCYLPIMPTQPYNIPVQCCIAQLSTNAYGQLQTHPNASLILPQVVLKQAAALPQSVAELTSQQYRKLQAGHPLVNVISQTETETRLADAQIQHQSLSFSVAAGKTANYANKLDDDPACVQIYKSQPPPQMLPSQYYTMTKATTLLLSEALAKLHTDNAEQQITTSEPQ